jgi:hypothetical protein
MMEAEGNTNFSNTFRQHLWQVVGMGEAATDRVQFERGFYRAFPGAFPKTPSDQYDFLDKLQPNV